MKKTTYLKALIVAFAILGGVQSVWAETTTVGETNNTTGWWSAFSDYYTIAPNHGIKISFKNYTSKAENWFNYIAVLTTDADRGASGYSEYGVMRADCYGWQGSKNTNNDKTWFTTNTNNYNWTTFKDDMDAASVVMTVTRKGAEVTMHFDVTTAAETPANYNHEFVINCGDGTQNIRVFLTTENGHLTDISSTVLNSYTINAVAGGSTIKELASGFTSQNVNYSANAPKVIVKDDKYYVLNDGQDGMNGSQATYTMSTANIVKEINYTLDESIVYFKEAESYAGSNSATTESRASGGAYTAYYRNNTSGAVTTLNKGVYSVETYIWNRTDKEINLYKTAKDNANILASLTGSGSQSRNFLIDANSTATVIGCVNNSCCFDYILIRKLYNVEGEVVGNVNYTSGANSVRSANYTMKKGDTKIFTFQNHGTTYGNNWRIEVKEGETWKSNTCADCYDYTIKKHLDNDGDDSSDSWAVMSTDGGISKTGLNWDRYTEDMADANVVATITYGTDGKLTINAISTGTANNYKYYVDNVGHITGEGDLTINLSVCNSWLEVLGVENTTVGGTIPSSGFGTLASAYGLNFADATGLTAAYVVTQTTTGVAKLASVDELPANSGVILEGTPGASYSIPVKADATYAGTNLLKAAVTATPIIADEAYILQSGAFHLVTEASTVPAGKAYLLASNVPSGARALSFIFDDEETTGIHGIENGELRMENSFFDLQGRRVAKPTKGLYIVNGKKVIIK